MVYLELNLDVDQDDGEIYEEEEEEIINTTTPEMVKKPSQQSNDSHDSVDMVFPHLTKKLLIHEEDNDSPFSVTHPVKGSHVSYTVKGIDDDGPFEGSRRYNDFYFLRNALVSRWPGVYFPPIPPKKKVGNKEHKFLEERRYFLQRFLRNLAKIDFITTSEEFKIFSRSSADIEKSLSHLPKPTPDHILSRFQMSFKPNINHTEQNILFKATISEFQLFSSKILPVLKSIKSQVKALAPVSQQQKSEYLEFLRMLEEYEDQDLSITSHLNLGTSHKVSY